MRVLRYAGLVAGITVALAATTNGSVAAQDTTRRAVSDQRIPLRKDGRYVQESRGDVALAAEVTRINALEESAATLRQRLEAAEAELATLTALTGRVEANEGSIRALEGTLRTTREELAGVRSELVAANARANALAEQVAQFDRRMNSLTNGSLFGHSGFFIGVGTGVNFVTGTIHNIGYRTGLNVVMPFGWSKPNNLFGLRGELGVQTFDGRIVSGFTNVDPRIYTATAQVMMNLPFNEARTNLLYLMGGGGVYMFDRVGKTSTLDLRMGESDGRVTKFGVTGGAGLEFHILGATSLFVQSAFTNVFAEKPVNTPGSSGNLRWVPLVAGITLR
jgi:hypothetical protein